MSGPFPEPDDDWATAVFAACSTRRICAEPGDDRVVLTIVAPRLLGSLTGTTTRSRCRPTAGTHATPAPSDTTKIWLTETTFGSRVAGVWSSTRPGEGRRRLVPPFDVLEPGRHLPAVRQAPTLNEVTLDGWFGRALTYWFVLENRDLRDWGVGVAPADPDTQTVVAYDQYLAVRRGELDWRDAVAQGGSIDGKLPRLITLASSVHDPAVNAQLDDVSATVAEASELAGRAGLTAVTGMDAAARIASLDGGVLGARPVIVDTADGERFVCEVALVSSDPDRPALHRLPVASLAEAVSLATGRAGGDELIRLGRDRTVARTPL